MGKLEASGDEGQRSLEFEPQIQRVRGGRMVPRGTRAGQQRMEGKL